MVEINIFENMLPLVSGYLQASARAHPALGDSQQFHKYTTTIHTDSERIVADILEHDSDVYALSSYLWNMGLIKSIVPKLSAAKPNALVLLGGPQVMHHAERYLNPDQENLFICNGEGEKTFRRRFLVVTATDLTV